MKYLYSVILVAIVVSGCSDGTVKRESVSPAKIERIDRFVANMNQFDGSSKESHISQMGDGLKLYLQLMSKDEDGSNDIIGVIDSLSQSAPMRVFYPEVEKRLKSLNEIEQQLGGLKQSLREKLPSIPDVRLYGIISPYRQGVITSDSIVLVALNLYLGPDYPGYTGFEEYFKNSRIADRIPYDIAEALITSHYPYTPTQSPTLISKMLYQGALVNIIAGIMPNADLAMALGISNKDLEWFQLHERELWEATLDKSLLYSTSELDAAKILSPGPSSDLLLHDAPGRAARFLGYRIVKDYIRTHNISDYNTLLSKDFYGNAKTLANANYSPGK